MKKPVLSAAIVLALATLTAGCSTTALSYMENRVVCTADGKEAHTVSKWGLFSIGARIAESDAAVVCAGQRPEVKPAQ